jgi:hypothetical protein
MAVYRSAERKRERPHAWLVGEVIILSEVIYYWQMC